MTDESNNGYAGDPSNNPADATQLMQYMNANGYPTAASLTQAAPQIPMTPNNPLVSEAPSADSLPPNIFLLPNEAVPANAQLENPQSQMTIPVGGVQSVSVGPDSINRVPAASKAVDQSQFKTPQKQEAAQTNANLALPQISKDVMGSYNDQIQKYNAISKSIADTQIAKEEALEVQQVAAQEEVRKQKDLKKAYESAYNSRVVELDTISKELAGQDFTEAKPLNANRFWETRSTPQKILGGIALALGGFASGFNGGPNQALEIINRAIDRDIEEQKFNINNEREDKKLKYGKLKDRMNVGQSMLQNLRGKYNDDSQAETALRLLYNQVSQTKIAELTSKIENKTQLASVAGIVGGLKREQAALQQQMQGQVLQQQILARYASDNVGEEMPPEVEAMLPKELREIRRAHKERSAPGWIGQAKDKESASKFVEKATEVQPAIDGAARILAMTSPNNPEFSRLNPEDRAKASTELVALVGQLRVPFVGPGAMTEKEYERIMNTLGDPNAILTMPSWQRVKLQTVFNKLNNDLDSLATSYGFRKKPVVDPSKKRPY